MEMELTDLINSINDLVNAIEIQSGIGILNFVFSVLASVFSVVIVDWIRESLKKPYKEFIELKSRINKGLRMYACCFTNPINKTNVSESETQLYWEARCELRKLSVDLNDFVCKLNRKRIGGVLKTELDEVSDLLMLLSNSMYHANSKDNYECKIKILRLLKIIR